MLFSWIYPFLWLMMVFSQFRSFFLGTVFIKIMPVYQALCLVPAWETLSHKTRDFKCQNFPDSDLELKVGCQRIHLKFHGVYRKFTLGWTFTETVSLEHYWSILPWCSVLCEKMIFNGWIIFQNVYIFQTFRLLSLLFGRKF